MPAPHRLRSLGFVLLLVSTAPAGQALAQAPPAATSVVVIREEVRKLHNDALLALKRNQLDAAYKGFLEAWTLQKIPQIAGNLGRTELKLKKYRDAAEHIAFFLREGRNLGDDERKDLQAQLAQAGAQVGVLRLEVVQAGAEVLINGVAMGASPLAREIYLEPGKHTVEARHAGSVAKKDIDARAGAEETVLLDVTPPAPSQATASPGVPSAPAVEDGAKPRLLFPALVVGGVGVASVIAGAVSLGIYTTKRDLAEALYKKIGPGGCHGTTPHFDCAVLESTAREADVFRGAGPALMIGGAVLTAAATAYWLWPRGAGRQGAAGGSEPHVGVMASQQGAAVSISGRF